MTILEMLFEANHRLNRGLIGDLPIAKNELHEAVTLLGKGYSLDTDVLPLASKYGTVENVPENF